MNLREALINQAPSLALQRAAADEIARLDGALLGLADVIDRLTHEQVAYRESLDEVLNLCAIGDVDEDTEAYGWGEAIKRANAALGRESTKEPT